jgi:hypothetical protein
VRRIGLLQVIPNNGSVVQSPGLQPVDYVTARQDNDGMPVFTDFAVSLDVEVRGSDQDAELAVPEPRDESTCLPYANTEGYQKLSSANFADPHLIVSAVLISARRA